MLKKFVAPILFFIISFILLALLIKGEPNSPLNFQYNYDTKVGGPFESSMSSSRFALTRSIIDYGSLTLNEKLARFASPDVADYNNKFFTLFTPGVSFLGVPFYILGNLFGTPQLFTYLATIIFALINIFLVGKLSEKLGASFFAGVFGGLTFLFATNALGYSLTFSQHHYSTFVILLGLLLATGERTFIKNIAFGGILGASLLFDIPNPILLSPALAYVAFKHLSVIKNNDTFKISLKLSFVTLILGALPFLGLFTWYNYQITGSPTKIAQFIGRSDRFKIETTNIEKPSPKPQGKDLHLIYTPFKTRKQLSGFYTLLLSNERSWIFYSPVLLFGLLGFYIAYKNRATRIMAILGFTVVLINVILYSMFGDPWGGWSFGPRYLIPSAAIIAAGIGLAFEKNKKNLIFLGIFLITLFYSTYISVLGATTTNSIPPKIEALRLTEPIPYTYDYNLKLTSEGRSSSLFYNLIAKNFVSVPIYIFGYATFVTLFFIGLYLLILKRRE